MALEFIEKYSDLHLLTVGWFGVMWPATAAAWAAAAAWAVAA